MEGTRLLDGMYDKVARRFVGVIEGVATKQTRYHDHLVIDNPNHRQWRKRNVACDLNIQ